MDLVAPVLFTLLSMVTIVMTANVDKPPQNTAQYRGRDVLLECGIDAGEPFQVQWAQCPSSVASCRPFINDDQFVPGVSGYDRYSTINRTSGTGKQFDLQITGLELADAGQFRCSDVGLEDKALNEVIVVEEPSCTLNQTNAGFMVGDKVLVTCNITYQGRWAPVMKFNDPSGNLLPGSINHTTSGQASYSVVATVNREFEGRNVSMQAFFATPTGTGDNEATNTPSFPRPDTFNIGPFHVTGVGNPNGAEAVLVANLNGANAILVLIVALTNTWLGRHYV